MLSVVLSNLLLTILIETPLYIWWFSNQKIQSVVIFSFLLNGFTLPLATLLYNGLNWNFFLVEGCVLVAEGILCTLFWKIRPKSGFWVALIANSASAGAGKIIEEWLFMT